MKGKLFGTLAVSAVTGLLAGAGWSGTATASEDKACYRKTCGDSVKGHKGQCSGTLVEGLTTEKECTAAGGVWTTAEEAKKLKM